MNNIEILEEWLKEMDGHFKRTYINNTKEREALRFIIQEYKELQEYKKIAELTKISCCTAQNCEALNNAFKNRLENEKLLQKNKELEEKNKKIVEKTAQLININRNVIKENYIPKSKLKEIIYPTPENPISFEVQSSEMYKRLEKLVEGE